MNPSRFSPTDAKSFLKSKTMIGLFAACLGLLGRNIPGFNLDDENGRAMAVECLDALCLVLEGGGLLMAAYGRFKAKQSLTKPGKGSTLAAAFLAFHVSSLPCMAHSAMSGGELIQMGLAPMILNMGYALLSFLITTLLWFCVLDKLMLRGFSTSGAIKNGNLAAASFAGLGFLGLAVMIGLVIG